MGFYVDPKMQLCDALVSLVQEMPLEKITVQKIADRCGVTRTTFYRYFQDKYDLLAYAYSSEAEKTMTEYMENRITYFEFVAAVCGTMREKSNFFRQAFAFSGQNSFYNSICMYNRDALFIKYRKTEETQTVDPRKFQYLALAYAAAVTTIFQEWALSGMKESPESVAAMVCEACPSIISESLLLF